jgi:hypothetical protein
MAHMGMKTRFYHGIFNHHFKSEIPATHIFFGTFSRGMSRALDRICMESAIVTSHIFLVSETDAASSESMKKSQDLADEIHIGAVPQKIIPLGRLRIY